MIKTPVPTDPSTRTPARRTHALEGSRPGSSKLSVCAALSVVDFRFSPGRAEACTARSQPLRGRGASSAAHAEHVLTSRCCVGRSGAGGQRTATQHQTSTKQARACRRTSARPIGLARGPRPLEGPTRDLTQRTLASAHERERTASGAPFGPQPPKSASDHRSFFLVSLNSEQ